MCGIFGVVWHKVDAIPDEHRLKETACLLHHRGPDSMGIYADVGIGLVHTRLSLLDLSPQSNQPFWDKERRYCLIYNGEIYNFKELRTELELRGIKFITTSDTEVLLEWLINCGIEATLPRLEGMFAFSLYDRVERTLLLARDRFGIKPLFVYDSDDAFIFASEIQAMRPWIKIEPDILSISSYLYGFAGPTKGYSFFKNVKFLSPGSFVRMRIGEPEQYSNFFSISNFWDKDQAEQLKRLKPQQLVDKVDELLFQSVKKQLFADVPVGVLCSGGLDSSITTAMAAKLHSNLAIFHADVVGAFSEHEAAAQLAKHLRIDLKAVKVHNQDFIDMIPETTEHYGHPFYFIPSSTPFLMVSNLVRSNGIKAVLSGEGSDECFLGYDFLAPNILKWKNNTKKMLKKLMNLAVNRRGVLRECPTEWDTYTSCRVPLSTERLVMGLHNRFEVALETEDLFNHAQGTKGRMIYKNYVKSLDLFNYNLRALLHRNDSLGMAASIEARFPFLDSELVKLAVNMPYNCRIRFSPMVFDKKHYFFTDKWVLRKVAERYMPNKLCYRVKQPFNLGMYNLLQISPTFFEKSFIGDLLGLTLREIRYLIHNAQYELKLKLMHLDVWAHVCLLNLPKQSIVKKLKDHVRIRH